MDASLPSDIPCTHGAATRNTAVQNSTPGESLVHSNFDQVIDDSESVHGDDDFTQVSVNSISLARWVNRVPNFEPFIETESKNNSAASYENGIKFDAVLPTMPDDDEFLATSMNRSIPREEYRPTPLEPSLESALSESDTTEDDDSETMEDFKARLIDWIVQMMFVSGETAEPEPSPETTWMIEEIVREQVLEMVCLPPLSKYAQTSTESTVQC